MAKPCFLNHFADETTIGLYAHVDEVLAGRFCKLFNKVLTIGQKTMANNKQVDDTYNRTRQTYITQFEKTHRTQGLA